jgi:3-deoxy-D-manno-octulosonic-acid transferase
MFFYRLAQFLLFPLVALFFAWRFYKGKEHPTRWSERWGYAPQPRPTGVLVWVHCASVGEAVSVFPLIGQLLASNNTAHILLTTGTRTAARVVKNHLASIAAKERALHQFVPLDLWPCVHRFMRHWQPDVSVFLESEFWPELVTQAPRPMLINARVSDRSFEKYQKYLWLFGPVISRFSLVLAQREEDAKRLRALGAPQVKVGGNLKYDAPPLPADEKTLEELKDHIGKRPVLVAASTHTGEEEGIASLHNALATDVPNLLTILVPRHPNRGDELAGALNCPQRSRGALPTEGTTLYLADTLGELGLWYRLAQVAIIGGTLKPIGGHNPLEPLKLGIITLTGPYMFNFRDMNNLLTSQSILHIAQDTETLTSLTRGYLTDITKAQQQREKIARVIPTLSGATTLAVKEIMKRASHAHKS